jgi:MscS family membrane protein
MFRYNLNFKRAAISLLLLCLAGSADARHPLEPADTSSPRATMESFLTLTDEVAKRLETYRDTPSPAAQKALMQAGLNIRRLLDLSQVPPTARYEVAGETYLFLWDVMARLELPHLQEIPDANAVMERDDKAKGSAEWQLPGTEITIARVAEGPRAGEFLFSPDTVERLPDFYAAVHELPYRWPMPSDDLIRTNQLFTGWLIPMAWVETLPDWANTALLGQVLWKWFLVLLLSALSLGMVIAVFLWARRREWGASLSTYVRRLSAPMLTLVLAFLLRYFFQYQINLTGAAASVPDYIIEIAYGIAMVWLIWLTASWIAEAIIASPRIHPDSLDANILRLVARAVGITAALVLAFRSAHYVGIPVYGLVAGAGVGGLAIALAARSTLENFMAALNLFADHPVRVGDLCRYDAEATAGWSPVGRVESIGLRSTKIRKLDRTLITIPNAEFAQLHIVNFDKCDRMLLNTTLSLRYETSDDQLRFVLTELRELLHAHPKTIHTAADPIRVRFVEYGDHSLNVAIRVYIDATDYNDFLGMQEDILLRMMKVVEQAGTRMALPARTLYVGRDGGLDTERQQDAEKQVREWSSAHALPFPDFSEDYRRKITDKLDYPPEGSPGAHEG